MEPRWYVNVSYQLNKSDQHCEYWSDYPWDHNKERAFFINLVRIFWMDGLTKAEHALIGACCAGPDPNHPIGKFQNSRQDLETIPQSRTRCAMLTDFYRLRPLPPTAAIPVRSLVNIERRSASNPGCHHRGPVLYQLTSCRSKKRFVLFFKTIVSTRWFRISYSHDSPMSKNAFFFASKVGRFWNVLWLVNVTLT